MHHSLGWPRSLSSGDGSRTSAALDDELPQSLLLGERGGSSQGHKGADDEQIEESGLGLHGEVAEGKHKIWDERPRL